MKKLNYFQVHKNKKRRKTIFIKNKKVNIKSIKAILLFVSGISQINKI